MLHYGAHSSRLREAVADLAMHLANGIVDWTDIRALMAKRLIALDKCPGVHPIGIGECLRHILGCVLALVTGWEAQSACGWISLLVGCNQELKGLFTLCQPCMMITLMMVGAFFLMDATNVYNSVNRAAALWNT